MIETKRLLIIPLTYSQLQMYLLAGNTLEDNLGVKPGNREISPELQEALETVILPSVADDHKNPLFSTLWTLILKEGNEMVGDLCFYGEPDTDGQIEIGYGTYQAFRNQGFMTEAVEAMIVWAAQQAKVKLITAKTEKTNPASYSVLLKNQFSKTAEDDELLYWQLPLNP